MIFFGKNTHQLLVRFNEPVLRRFNFYCEILKFVCYYWVIITYTSTQKYEFFKNLFMDIVIKKFQNVYAPWSKKFWFKNVSDSEIWLSGFWSKKLQENCFSLYLSYMECKMYLDLIRIDLIVLLKEIYFFFQFLFHFSIA